MRKGKIYIGTSGWSYKGWKGDYYPEKMKATDWLNFYAHDFDITEINASFYRLPTQQTVINWVEKVPARFKFCPKISRYLTHMKKLRDPEEPLQRFFDIFEPMKKRMGPVLVQLPHMVAYNPEVAEHFFKILKKDYKAYDFALEVRHDTWLQKEAIAMMEKYDVAFVVSQSGVGWPYAEIITSKNIYVRFHGPGKLYASSYNEATLQSFADMFRKWMHKGHDVWAFFNNDVHTYAVANAKTLKEMMR